MDYTEEIIKQLGLRIPEFKFDEGEPKDIFIIFSFFATFIREHINNEDLLERIAFLVNDLCLIDDIEVMAALDDLAISLYDDGNYDLISLKFSPKAKECFEETISKWEKGNGI